MASIQARDDLRAQIYLAKSIGGNIGAAAGMYMNEKKKEAAQQEIVRISHDPNITDEERRLAYSNVKNGVLTIIGRQAQESFGRSLFEKRHPTQSEYLRAVNLLGDPDYPHTPNSRLVLEAQVRGFEEWQGLPSEGLSAVQDTGSDFLGEDLTSPGAGLAPSGKPEGFLPQVFNKGAIEPLTEAEKKQFRDLGVPEDKLPGTAPIKKKEEFKPLIKEVETEVGPRRPQDVSAGGFSGTGDTFYQAPADPSEPPPIKQITDIEKSNLSADDKVAAMVDVVTGKQEEAGDIQVRHPNGQVGTIPAEDWEEAKREGYTRL